MNITIDDIYDEINLLCKNVQDIEHNAIPTVVNKNKSDIKTALRKVHTRLGSNKYYRTKLAPFLRMLIQGKKIQQIEHHRDTVKRGDGVKIIIMHQNITMHDAIGNDIEHMYHILFEEHDCRVFGQNQSNTNLSYIDEKTLCEEIKRKENIIIYHHSTYWKLGEEILRKTKAKIIIKYHNITPKEYFLGYDTLAYQQCEKGRNQTDRLISEFPDAIWMCDSSFNAQDLKGVENTRIFIVPPFNNIEQWINTRADEQVIDTLSQNADIKLLFVGRIAPNKGHLKLLDIVQCYRKNYGDNIKLSIIGKFDPNLAGYNQLIIDRIKAYELDGYVEFVGEITDSTLLSYYQASDFYINVSEHEGFCVPLLEAQCLGLPVVALDTTVIPETIGPEQVALGRDEKQFAAAIHALHGNKEYYSFLQQKGKANYNTRFSYEAIKKDFRDVIDRMV
ncbi:MAG: glycosyltransferase family 4 protein [Lachnospiraceae bacterium]